MIGGLKAGMGYVGAGNLEHLRENAQFVQMSGNGLKNHILTMFKLQKKLQTIQLNNKD